MKLLSKFKGLFYRKNKVEEKKPEYLIWGVTDGPVARSEVPEEAIEDVPEGYDYFLVVKASEDGKMVVDNVWFKTLDSALDIKYYFDTNIEPLVYKE